MDKFDKRKTVYSAIGAAAFVVGGILARAKAIESAAIVEDFFAENFGSKESSDDDLQ